MIFRTFIFQELNNLAQLRLETIVGRFSILKHCFIYDKFDGNTFRTNVSNFVQ